MGIKYSVCALYKGSHGRKTHMCIESTCGFSYMKYEILFLPVSYFAEKLKFVFTKMHSESATNVLKHFHLNQNLFFLTMNTVKKIHRQGPNHQ